MDIIFIFGATNKKNRQIITQLEKKQYLCPEKMAKHIETRSEFLAKQRLVRCEKMAIMYINRQIDNELSNNLKIN